jgi:holin-like protein
MRYIAVAHARTGDERPQPLSARRRLPAAPGPALIALRGLALLLLLQAAGEGLAHALSLPFPGPVIGLVLLLAALSWAPLRAPVAAAAEALLAHLSLLFVPVGVGVITHLALVSQYGLRLLLVIVLSTWIGLAVTALVLRGLLAVPPVQRPGDD